MDTAIATRNEGALKYKKLYDATPSALALPTQSNLMNNNDHENVNRCNNQSQDIYNPNLVYSIIDEI